MKFKPGDLVWIGFYPDHLVETDARYMQGEIVRYYGIENLQGYGETNMWVVDCKDRERPVRAPEFILVKIYPGDGEDETNKPKIIEVENE